MGTVRDVMIYFCRHYPHKSELSKARLTKMVYLADWTSALRRGRQITGITWIFNHHGPYVKEITDIAREDPLFCIEETTNFYGEPKELIGLNNDAEPVNLLTQEVEILDFVIDLTASKYWKGFIQLVYNTFPIKHGVQFEKLDLVESAREFLELNHRSQDQINLNPS